MTVSCRFNCPKNIIYTERQKVLSEFWQMGDHSRQWDYIDKSIQTTHLGAKPDEKNQRTISRQFFLTVDKRKVKVCSTIFLHTFGTYYSYIFFSHLVTDCKADTEYVTVGIGILLPYKYWLNILSSSG